VFEEHPAKYRSIVDCCKWTIVLGRFYIAYTTSAMSRFNMSPREQHLKAAKRILACSKTFTEGRIIVDTAYTNHYSYPIEDHPNWNGFYADGEEEIPNDRPKSNGLKVRVTFYVDADHAHDLATRKSIAGVLLIALMMEILYQ
jgi:hypothetical protein